jgi:hypothetical protein
MKNITTTLSIAAAIAAAGCTEPAEPVVVPVASFTAQVAGATTTHFAGAPRFTEGTAGNGFALALEQSISATPTPRTKVFLHSKSPGVPGFGAHQIESDTTNFRAGVVLDADGDDPVFCSALSGWVRFEPSPGPTVRGTFAFTAVCAHRGGNAIDQPVEVSGNFVAAPGAVSVPDFQAEMRPVGRYALAMASYRAIPSSVFDGVVLGDADSFFRLEVVATGGYLEMASDGRYEQRVYHTVRINGQLAPALNVVDRGKCTMGPHRMSCTSSYLENTGFVAFLVGPSLDVAQDLAHEGYPVVYRYSHEGPTARQ